MGKLTDEEFRDFLKTCRELAEGPFEEMQREVEVTNKFPQEFIDLARENNLYRYALPEQYGGGASPRRRSCRCRRSSRAARAACACTCTTPPT